MTVYLLYEGQYEYTGVYGVYLHKRHAEEAMEYLTLLHEEQDWVYWITDYKVQEGVQR